MFQVVIAPFVIGSVLSVGGFLLVIFSRQFVRRFPTYSARTDWAGTKSGTPPNTRLRVVMFGVVLASFGLLILLSGGLQLF